MPMPPSRSMHRCIALLAVLLLLAPIAFASAADSTRVDPGVARALRSNTQVRVLLLFEPAMGGGKDSDRRAAIARGADAVLAALPAKSTTVRRRFARVPALALEIDVHALERLKKMASVRRVELEVGGSGAMLQAAPLAHVSDTLTAGLTGSGAKIAIVDSGIDTDHADFAGRIVAQQCFCSGDAGAAGCCPNAADSMSGPGSAEDDHGHGTNVAGIAAGGGNVAQRGAAPEADLVAVKVIDSNNSFCCASDVVAAFDWILDNHPDTDVVNASLGSAALFTGTCDAAAGFTQALATAVANLVDNGTQVFVSSGNQGSGTSLSAPACVSAAMAVGAVWDANVGSVTVLGCTESTAADQATCFTNSNANVALYAPGAFVTSSGMGGATSTFAGTSQATPLTAGCAASIAAAVPAASPAIIAAALRNSPTSIVDAKNGLTFPRLDCASAALQLTADLFADGFEG